MNIQRFRTICLYLCAFLLALCGIILCAPVVYAQTVPPVCMAVSTDTVTDGQGLTRAGNYQCPVTLLVTAQPGVYQRAFLLVVQHFPLDNPTVQFSRRLPLTKNTGGAALDPLNSMDLRPGHYYLVVWRGEDHQVFPLAWHPVVLKGELLLSSPFRTASIQ